ncbi:MAG TPA: hypothetical protein VLA37_12545, partial [Sphingomonadaceae bacterium]|nr:hypothetical protein [Sphingomonadaceae bacterium]
MLLRIAALVIGLGLAPASYAKKTLPPAPVISRLPPPPPLVATKVPYRPLPPGGARPDMAIPSVGIDGTRQTILSDLTPLEAVWSFRSGWNVAALNCLEARYQPILDGYRVLLDKHARRLSAINRELDRQYRVEYGPAATREREADMTQLYNYFAMPPAKRYLCDATLEISNTALYAAPEDLDAFALAHLPRMQAAFEQFYRDFEQFYVDVAAWDAKYAHLFAMPADTWRPPNPGIITYTNAAASGVTFDSDGRVQLAAPGEVPAATSQP